jgi:hypothetical protein
MCLVTRSGAPHVIKVWDRTGEEEQARIESDEVRRVLRRSMVGVEAYPCLKPMVYHVGMAWAADEKKKIAGA